MNYLNAISYLEYNARVKGKVIDLDADREAVRRYFLDHVNMNLVSFLDLKEKLDYLVEEGYYEKEFLDKYKFAFIKRLRKHLEKKHFRFPGLVPALKFYSSYALKTFDGERYLERYEDRILAVALYLGGGDEHRAWDLAEEMIEQRYQPATPTFLNAGRKQRGEMVSCFLVDVQDDLNSIYRAINSAAQLSKRGGGVAINLSNIRPAGAPIKKMKGLSSGVIPVMKVLEDTGTYVNQLGQRQGAIAVYLNAHHMDIETFLDSKRVNSDEKIRMKTLNLGVVIPDITVELAANGENMYLFDSYDVERVYGKPFSYVDITKEYRRMVENPDIRKKHIDARDFFQQLAEVQFNSGYPYVMFEDNVNRANPIDGKIIMSNLCYTADTKVLTSKGYRTAGELYKDGSELEIISDNRAVQDGFGVFKSSATAMHKTAENSDIYQVITKEGYSIKATEWHKFYVDRAGQKVKIALNEMRPGDRLFIQSGEGAYGDFHDPDLAYLAGVFTADGTFTAYGEGVRFDLYGAKRQWIRKIETAVTRVIANYGGSSHHSANDAPAFVESSMADRASLSSASIAQIFAGFGLVPGAKTGVPDFIWSSDRQTQGAYLSGIYQMDGSLSVSKKYKTASIELTSVDHKFIQDVQLLLLNAGVSGRIYDGAKAGFKNLPDGNGGYKEYWCQATKRIFIQNRQSREAFIGFVELKPEDLAKYEEYKTWVSPVQIAGPRQKFMVTVDAITFVGTEDVYDITVPGHHSQLANGILTGNCSEILQVQEPGVLNDDQTYSVMGKDISCNLGSLNIKRVMESPNFGKTIEVAIRALTEVSDKSDIQSVPTIDSGNKRSHAVGLGQMNLHGYLASQRIHYGSPEALDFIDSYAAMVTYHAINTSMLIAKERGESFDGFEDSAYADGTYFDKYIEQSHVPTAQVADLFASHYVPTTEDWEELACNVALYGMYNQNLQAIPPTGSISYVNNSVPSILPATARVEVRKEGKLGRVNFPAPGISNETFEYYKDAYEYGNKAIIDTVAAFQKHVDQGISNTLFFTSEDTTEDINRMQAYAHYMGCKCIYYIRVKSTVLEGTDNDTVECESCSV